MIIDVHGHVSAPTELWAYKANLLSARGAHGRGGVNVSDDETRAAANAWRTGPKAIWITRATTAQTSSYFPRPFPAMQMESQRSRPLVHRGMQQYHPPPDEAFYRQVDRRLRPAANGGRSDSECDSRARTLREAARFCRLSFESGSIRKQRHRSTAARRPLLVSAL